MRIEADLLRINLVSVRSLMRIGLQVCIMLNLFIVTRSLVILMIGLLLNIFVGGDRNNRRSKGALLPFISTRS